jgi:Cu-Zn family superoxide dismutase
MIASPTDGGADSAVTPDGGTDGGAPTADGGADAASTDGGSTTDGGGDAELMGNRLATSTGAWVVFADPYGDGMPNPAMGITGSAEAWELGGGRTRIRLQVANLPPNRAFGSHLHKLSCEDMKAGGHYQHMPFPPDGSATDPAFANPANEAWLDFTTDATGAARSETTVSWKPRAGEAKSIIVHHMATGDGGVAGAKLACLPFAF